MLRQVVSGCRPTTEYTGWAVNNAPKHIKQYFISQKIFTLDFTKDIYIISHHNLLLILGCVTYGPPFCYYYQNCFICFGALFTAHPVYQCYVQISWKAKFA